MADYDSNIHLPRWRRAVIWMANKALTNPLAGMALGLVVIGPAFLIGWWWLAILAAFTIGGIYGYNLARWEWIDNGDVPKL